MRHLALVPVLLCLAASASAHVMTPGQNADVAALQVALRADGVYAGTVDGLQGLATTAAIIAFQRREGLEPDGIAGSKTRRALGLLGAPELGARILTLGDRGWDVAEAQFMLAWHGFPSGPLDAWFGAHTEAAVRRFQRHAAIPETGQVGPLTIAALAGPPPVSPLRLLAPVSEPLGDRFGPRGGSFHAGVDYVAPAGTPVAAARAGIVTLAGARGSFGNAVVVKHGSGVRTLYAHLARVDVNVGERVSSGAQLGVVGSTGRSTGPHLHFEVRVRGAAIDPLTAIG